MLYQSQLKSQPLCASQIQELQKEYGGSTEGSEPIKPLAHILLEAKQAKDEAFQNQWKQMKQGASPFTILAASF